MSEKDNPDFMLREIYTAIYGKHGLLVRTAKIETELKLIRWFIPIGVGIAIFLAELALKLVAS